MSNNDSSIRASLVKIEQLRNEGLFNDAKKLAIETEQTWSNDKRVSRFIGMYFVAMNWHSEIAADMLEKSLPDFPNDADMHNLYSYACWIINRKQGAIKGALRAIEINPNKMTGYLRLGMFYLTEQRHTEAFSILSEGISACKNNKDLLQ